MNASTANHVLQLPGHQHLQTREVRRRVDFLMHHPMLSCSEALLRLQASGFSEAGALREVRAQRILFYVQLIDVSYFPAFQWRHVQLRGGIARVLDVFAGARTKWQVALWFVSQHELLGGLRPIDLLDQDPGSVARAAAFSAGVRGVSH